MARPSAFPTGLQPVASNDLNGHRLQRRISRTDLDFEQALRAPGTVLLREGIDVNTLGVPDSPAPVNRSYSTPRTISRVPLQPATPTIVPPSPSPARDLQSIQQPPSKLAPAITPSPGGSSHDLLTDYEEAERQTNRRSMYRSPGTSSSPDLATLLRKAKERGGVMVGSHKKDKRRESPPPPLPTQQVVSSSSTTLVAPSHNHDWQASSPKPSRDNGTIKVSKTSVRAKTSAFWGKMIGQSTVRERSKTDASQSPLMHAFVPPSDPPPLPPPLPPPSSRPIDSGKPLPPIHPHDSEEPDDRSIVIVEKTSTLPPIPTSATKRRSMSVSDVDLRSSIPIRHDPQPAPSFQPPHPISPPEEGALGGMLDVFKGELSSLDPFSGTGLQLRDPSLPPTPSRQSSYRAKTDTSRDLQGERVENAKPTLPTLATKRSDLSSNDDPGSAIVPPRTSSLSPTRYSIGSQSARTSNTTPLRSPPHRLRTLHRSSASNSEPSLIPAGHNPSPRMSSHQDLSSAAGEDIGTRGRELAARCWDENDDFLPKEKIAEWLGGIGQVNKVALKHYVDYFDFTGLRLDIAFRNLCSKLYLKAETQQVDRILEQFSRRYWDCNPSSLYGSTNIVHAVSYSLLLLNTDLHVAELANRMSRSQFVRNTLTAIQTQLQPSSPSSDGTYDDCSSSIQSPASDETETGTRSKRSDSVTSWNSLTREAILSPLGTGQINNGSTPSIQVSNNEPSRLPYGRAWELEMEGLLKEMYAAIKNQQILQPISASRPSISSLSPGGAVVLRNRSLRAQPDRLGAYKRGSIRGLQSVLNAQAGVSPFSSNSSIDGRVSPSPSFATSTHETMYGSSSSFLNPTLGFASNLSHTIIREAQEDDDRSVHSTQSTDTTISISDEELALLGAPWAKEGMLCRKHFWEAAGKRAKDKAWMDVFVVIQKGELSMFVFGDNAGGSSGTVGGGNWLSNARPVGTILLTHCLAHALPPPGYNKRPHCMVLTLANRGVYFFQAGTEELVNEWVSTCNYWAARTSKEPLAGGVSNMEYGWNRVADIYGHGRSQSQTELPREPDTISVRSGKSNRSKYGWRDGSATMRYSPRTDKTFINEWKPPMPPSVASPHDEETQLDALRKHVTSLKKDLETHNELREPMLSLYAPRSTNAMKAQGNWEEKSQYLLREIVKYEVYIDSLQAAMTLRLKKRGDKALDRSLKNSTSANDLNHRRSQRSVEDSPDSAAEPATPIATQMTHRRETAEDGDVTD